MFSYSDSFESKATALLKKIGSQYLDRAPNFFAHQLGQNLSHRFEAKEQLNITLSTIKNGLATFFEKIPFGVMVVFWLLRNGLERLWVKLWGHLGLEFFFLYAILSKTRKYSTKKSSVGKAGAPANNQLGIFETLGFFWEISELIRNNLCGPTRSHRIRIRKRKHYTTYQDITRMYVYKYITNPHKFN